jgi:hypothetical protein
MDVLHITGSQAEDVGMKAASQVRAHADASVVSAEH